MTENDRHHRQEKKDDSNEEKLFKCKLQGFQANENAWGHKDNLHKHNRHDHGQPLAPICPGCLGSFKELSDHERVRSYLQRRSRILQSDDTDPTAEQGTIEAEVLRPESDITLRKRLCAATGAPVWQPLNSDRHFGSLIFADKEIRLGG